MSWDCVMLVGLLKSWGNGYCSCWTTWPWYWVLQSATVALQISTTLVARSVSSLSPPSSSPSADGLRQKIIWPMGHLAPSVTARACAPLLTNIGRLQRGQPLTRSCLPSSQPKPHELPVKRRKLESNRQVRSCAGVADESRGRMESGRKTTRGKRTCTRAHAAAASLACQHPIFGESSLLEQNRVTAAKVQRYTVTLNEFLAFAKMSLDELHSRTHVLSRVRSRSGSLLHGSNQVRRMDSKLLRSSPRRAGSFGGYRRLASGMSRGPLPWVTAAPMIGVAQWWRKTRSLQ